jgi:hypothetical protein
MNSSHVRRAIADLRVELDRLEAALGSEDRPGSKDLRTFQFLEAIEHQGSIPTIEEFSKLGRAKGYDPRGLGGFFSGNTPALQRNADGSTILTDAGRRWLDHMRDRYRL